MRAALTALVMVASLPAFAQESPEVRDVHRKRILCRQQAEQLIGLDRNALRERCGIWSHINEDVTASGTREQIVFDRHLYVYLRNGVVTSVQKR